MKIPRIARDNISILIASSLIVLISFYYKIFYPSLKYLPHANLSETLISVLTSIFNGYTETVSVSLGVFSNFYNNLIFTLALFMFFYFFERASNNAKNINKTVIFIFLLQIVFVPIYWFLILPLINRNEDFKGGLSLWNTLLLSVIIIQSWKYAKRGISLKSKQKIYLGLISLVIYIFLAFYSILNSLVYFILILVFISFVCLIYELKSSYTSRNYWRVISLISTPIFTSVLLAYLILPVTLKGKFEFIYPHWMILACFILMIILIKPVRKFF